MKASSIAALLTQKCCTITSIRKARQCHALLLTSASPILICTYTFNNILSMYARCGSLVDSQLVFDRMPHRNVVSYNSLISAYSGSFRHAPMAFQLFNQLENESLRPNESTFTSLLQASSTMKDLMLGFMLHAQCIKFGFSNNVFVETSLVGLYSNCGDMELAKKVFHFLVDKDAMAWNTLIYGYMENDKMAEGLQIFSTMMRNGARPNQFTYSIVLSACSRLADYHSGKLVHGHALVTGTCFDLPLHNALLDMYCSCGDIVTSASLFSEIMDPNLASWNTIIAGYSDNGHGAKAMELFVDLGRESVGKPDEYTYAAVISATGAFPASEYGKSLHAQIEKAGLQGNVYVGSTLVTMYFSNRDPESAQKIFSSVLEKDVVLWTDMVAGHCKIGDGEGAIKFFHGMLAEGHMIDNYALSSALSACADLATCRQGEMIHSQAVRRGYDTEVSVSGSLVDMYAKIGDIQAAELAFSLVTGPDLRCWNSMLGGYCHHGQANAAFKVLDDILECGLKPDQVTYISLLAACSHCGLVNKGKFFWNYMKENGLEPGPKHYSCMISLLSRAGSLDEAREMIIESPFSDDYLERWKILLNSCVMKGELRMGSLAARHILAIDPEDSATNVLLGKLYAATGRWDCVAEIRRRIREQVSEKDPGLSWTEIMSRIQVFSSGDRSHAQINELQAELIRLLKNLTQPEIDQI